MMNKKQGTTLQSVTLNPFAYITPSMQTTALCTIVFFIPQLLLLVMTKTYGSLFVILAASLGSLAAEGMYSAIRRTFDFSWLLALIQGLIIGFLLPSTYPPFLLFCITLCAMLLCKYAFGGFSDSWINPAAITLALAYILDIAVFPPYQITAEQLQTANASLQYIQNGSVSLLKNDASITAFLNAHVFRHFGIGIPEGYVSFVWDSGSVIPAFRFNFLTVITSLFFFTFEMLDGIIPLLFLSVYAMLVRFIPLPLEHALGVRGDILLALLTSGTLFSTVFLLQWFGTTPVTRWGKVLYGVLAGIAGYVIMGYGTSSIGYVFMVLIMNVCSVLIQEFENYHAQQRMEKVLLPRLRSLREEV